MLLVAIEQVATKISGSWNQNCRQKVLNRGALRLCRGDWRSANLIKAPLNHSVSYFNLGVLELCLGCGG